MGVPVLDPSSQGISLMVLTKLSAMLAGAVSGAFVAWLSRRNVLLTLCAFLLGIMGGMITGTGLGNLFYVASDGVESIVRVGFCSICSALGASMAGAIPTAFVISIFIGFLWLRHLKPRPPRIKTVLKGFAAGAVVGTLATAVWAVV